MRRAALRGGGDGGVELFPPMSERRAFCTKNSVVVVVVADGRGGEKMTRHSNESQSRSTVERTETCRHADNTRRSILTFVLT